MNKFALTVENLTKIYLNSKTEKQNKALNEISFGVEQGEVFGLLGPNGAGKTTFLSILGGTVVKTSGKVNVWGFDLDKNPRQVKASVGIVPQEINLDAFFSPKQLLELQAGLYGIAKKDRITDLILKIVALEDKANAYSRNLSGGMKRRLLIAKAMVHQPPILILDEPTAGVDIELRYMLWDFLKKINEKGKTVLLTTHYIEEAEQLCDRIAIIDNGKIIVDDTTENLTEKNGESQLVIECDNLNKDINLDGINFNIEEHKIIIKTDSPNRSLPLIMEKLNNTKVVISNIEIKKNTLEEVFLKLTKNNATN